MPEKYALLIGCNYINVPGCRLYGCINDIENMRDMLVANMSFKPENITMLRDDLTGDLVPTRSAIIRELMSIVQKSANAAEVWIHYSGHGSQVVDRNRDEISGRDSCIVPVDFFNTGFIIDDEILRIIRGIKCPAVILSDSCYSATVCDLPYSIEYLYGTTFRFSRNNNAAIPNPKIIMMSGCKDTQTSADIYDGEHGEAEGAFTDAFLRALKKNNYRASLAKVYVDTLTWLANNRFSQKPILSSSTAMPSWTFGGVNVVSKSLGAQDGQNGQSWPRIAPENRMCMGVLPAQGYNKMSMVL